MRRYLPTLWYFGKRFLFTAVLSGFYLLCFPVFRAVDELFSDMTGESFVIVAGAAILAVFLLRSFWRFLKPFYGIYKVRQHEEDILTSGNVITYEGGPGTGKTLSMTYDVVLLRDCNWGELQFEMLYDGAKGRYDGFSDVDDYRIYRTMEDTVRYYDEHPEMAPLLISKYPIRTENGQMSCKLCIGHFFQEQRLPEKAAVAYDESADDLSNTRSKPGKRDPNLELENALISETMSKERHYGDWNLLFAEQDAKEIFIGQRRVTALNRRLTSLVKFCEPESYLKRLGRLRNAVMRAGECNEKQYRKISRLKKKIAKIGFFLITYIDYDTFTAGGEELGRGTYCLPCNLPFKYETRAYRFDYKALYQDLDLEVFDRLYIEDAESPTPEPPTNPPDGSRA